MRKKILALSLLLVLAFAVFSMPNQASAACQSSMWLTPHKGSSWVSHTNYLEGTSSYNGSGYVIVNMKTYKAYNLAFWGNFGGRARFGVPTSWNWSYPTWSGQPWKLYYNC